MRRALGRAISWHLRTKYGEGAVITAWYDIALLRVKRWLAPFAGIYIGC